MWKPRATGRSYNVVHSVTGEVLRQAYDARYLYPTWKGDRDAAQAKADEMNAADMVARES